MAPCSTCAGSTPRKYELRLERSESGSDPPPSTSQSRQLSPSPSRLDRPGCPAPSGGEGYPSETKVKRGDRIVHGNKNWSRSSGAMTRALAGRARGFKRCCLRSGRFDGSERNHYFRTLPHARRALRSASAERGSCRGTFEATRTRVRNCLFRRLKDASLAGHNCLPSSPKNGIGGHVRARMRR
jgi:hypothetical protein